MTIRWYYSGFFPWKLLFQACPPILDAVFPKRIKQSIQIKDFLLCSKDDLHVWKDGSLGRDTTNKSPESKSSHLV